MRMEAGLQVRQEMHMKLAPQVIQSIEILQLPMIELERRIDRELEENPLLELTQAEPETDGDTAQSEPSDAENTDPGDNTEITDVAADEENDEEQFERLDALTEYYEKHSVGESRPTRTSGDEKGIKQEALENSPGPEPTLQEHLLMQLSYLPVHKQIEEICKHIITNLDDRGYLVSTLEEIADAMNSANSKGEEDKAETRISLELVEKALEITQGLEPPGIAARDLKECLLLQLDRRDPDYKFVKELISDHIEDITKNRLPKMASDTGCSLESVKRAVEKIGSLNPRPGALYTNPAAPHVMPDVSIYDNDGNYEIVIENAWLPSLSISAYYARRLQEQDLDDRTREYLKKKLEAAQGIISAIEQRRATLESITEEIVHVQKDFFDKGEMHLKPLKMQDVADSVGVHVSTVSRAIANKYAQTPQGIYSLKRFFTGGTRKEDGNMESWDVVRQKMLQIVDGENKKKPLSDDAIADKLKEDGIDIARRTVAKYRKILDIPSSRMRKEY